MKQKPKFKQGDVLVAEIVLDNRINKEPTSIIAFIVKNVEWKEEIKDYFYTGTSNGIQCGAIEADVTPFDKFVKGQNRKKIPITYRWLNTHITDYVIDKVQDGYMKLSMWVPINETFESKNIANQEELTFVDMELPTHCDECPIGSYIEEEGKKKFHCALTGEFSENYRVYSFMRMLHCPLHKVSIAERKENDEHSETI